MLTIKNTDKIILKTIPYHKDWHVGSMNEIITYAPNTKRMTHYYDIKIVNLIKSRSESILLNRQVGDNSKLIVNCYELHCTRDGTRHVKLLTKTEIAKMDNLLNWIKSIGIDYK